MERFVPNILMKRIFTYLTFQELLAKRLVCKKFNIIIQDMMNESLFKINDRVKKRINLIRKNFNDNNYGPNLIRYFKILNYLRSELNVLITTTFIYTSEKYYTFGGGKILDYYNKVLSLEYDQVESYFAYIKIFHLVESFLDYFDEKVEPEILKRSKKFLPSWFGVKLINLLDCSLDLNFKIELSACDDFYLLGGKYSGEELHILDNIPNMKRKLTEDSEKRGFIKSIRNNIRWNNLLFCIEKTCAELSKSCFETGLHTHLKSSSILERSSKSSNEDEQPSVYYDVTLKCKKLHLPLRANNLIQSNDNLLIARDNLTIKEINDSDKDPSYEFNLVMKIRSRKDEGFLQERTLKIYNVGSSCVVTERVCKIDGHSSKQSLENQSLVTVLDLK